MGYRQLLALQSLSRWCGWCTDGPRGMSCIVQHLPGCRHTFDISAYTFSAYTFSSYTYFSLSRRMRMIFCVLSQHFYIRVYIYASLSWYSYIFCVAVRRRYDVITQSHSPRQGASRSHYERGVQRCSLVHI